MKNKGGFIKKNISDCSIHGIDCILEFPKGEDIKILQFADIQAMNYGGIRTINDRWNQVHNAFFSHGVTDNYIRYWQYIEEGVRKADPDLIVLTGDNIYGETDDNGELWLEMINVLDSFEVPWLCIFGNHDNESHKGLNWQIDAVAASKYGYMRKGSCKNGNSNYTVGIKQGDELKYVFYMLDSNFCRLKPHNYGESLLPDNPDLNEIQQTEGIYPDQMAWMLDYNEKITAEYGDVPSMVFLHIPPVEAYRAVAEKYPAYGTWPLYTDLDGDIGMAREGIIGFDTAGEFHKTVKAVNCVGMFMGHFHKVATSTVYDGIRYTFGLKTSTGDYHSTDMIGSTKITIKNTDNSFDVEYIYSEIDYPLEQTDG